MSDATERPLASVSLDADDLWSYLKTHGDAGWEERPSYLSTFIPRALDALDALGLRITFFLVGLDAAQRANGVVMREIVARGHEVGNHSYAHEPWLHRYSPERLAEEVDATDDAIAQATGARPVGFRGPGYSWSATLLEILAERGYVYDSSTWPTFIGPLARAYYVRSASFTREQMAERGALFGAWSDGLRPLKPYRWELSGGRTLLEIPVTTFPLTRMPIHQSYLLYLGRVSESLMLRYLRTALAACRLTGIEPSFLLHPTDVLGAEEAPQLRFFPGMDMDGPRKRRLLAAALTVLTERFAPVPMLVHARALLARTRLTSRSHPAIAMPAASMARRG
ncbi:MAG: polysaccharide deacetylase family protein [Gemmatimonadaceae bacterium]